VDTHQKINVMSYLSYVRLALNGRIFALEEELATCDDPARRESIQASIRTLEANYGRMIAVVRMMPHVTQHHYDKVIPKIFSDGVAGILIHAKDKSDVAYFLERFHPCAVAHREGNEDVFRWEKEAGTFRVFPYSIRIRLGGTISAWIIWNVSGGDDLMLPVRMELPEDLHPFVADSGRRSLSDGVFLVGCVPHIQNWTDQTGNNFRIKFPKAFYLEEGRLYTWRDLPFLSSL